MLQGGAPPESLRGLGRAALWAHTGLCRTRPKSLGPWAAGMCRGHVCDRAEAPGEGLASPRGRTALQHLEATSPRTRHSSFPGQGFRVPRDRRGDEARVLSPARAPVAAAGPRPVTCPSQAHAVCSVVWLFTTKKLVCDSFFSSKTSCFKRFSSAKQLHLSSNNLFISPFLKLIKDPHRCQPGSLISRR